VYAREAPEFGPNRGPMHPEAVRPELREDWEPEIEAARGFVDPAVRHYRWAQEYTGDEYVRLLRTHSDHIVLEPRVREALLAEVGRVVDARGGTLTLQYATKLCLARAR
jgi:hypothetical protein